MKPFQVIDQELKKQKAKKNRHFEEYNDRLIQNYDELNAIKFNHENKKRLKKRYAKHKSRYKLITLYIAFLLSKDLNYDRAIEISTLIATDELYFVLLEDLEEFARKAYISGYDKLIEDYPGAKKKSKFDGITVEESGMFEKILNNARKVTKQIQNDSKAQREKPNIEQILNTMSKDWQKENDKGKVTGQTEWEAEKQYNRGYIDACKDNEIKYVQFFAVGDERTTEMCISLNGQIFAVNGKNKFKRYSDNAKNIVEMEVDGMVQGLNLPPIEDHFHWCRSWVQAVKTLGANDNIKNVEKHKPPKYLETIDYNNITQVMNTLKKYEKEIMTDNKENAIIILQNGDVYRCYGNKTNVFLNNDMQEINEKLEGAYVTHNHPIDETEYTFSNLDINLFLTEKLKMLRGIDEKYIYQIENGITTQEFETELNQYTFEHNAKILYCKQIGLKYERWQNNDK